MQAQPEISIFGAGERTDATPSRHGESTYAFLLRVAGPVWDQCRALLNDWFRSYPTADRAALSARLRSHDDRAFTSAFWELYLHEMYRRDGWTIEIEPQLSSVSTRPDFLVGKDGMKYYVEARCVFEGGSDRGAAVRLQSIYDSLNSIESGPFHLAVTPARIGPHTPSTKKLRRDLEAWLAGLDPDAGDYLLNEENPERQLEWTQDDWHLIFYPLPRDASVRDTPAQRPLGAFLAAEASLVDDITPLRDVLSEKGSKYGVLAYPLVLAINIGSGFHHDRDTEQALFGTIGWRFNFDAPESDPLPILTEPGYWGWPGRPAHTHIAGVLLAEGLHYGRVARYAPTFWPHPRAARKIEPLPAWRVARPGAEGMTHHEPSVRANEYFELPPGWPIGDRFPYTNQKRGSRLQ